MTDPTTPDQAAPSAPAYIVVWLALVVLATVTLLVSRAPIGDWGIVVALAIASLKAALVLAFFMHLAHGPAVHRLVICVAIAFVVLLVARRARRCRDPVDRERLRRRARPAAVAPRASRHPGRARPWPSPVSTAHSFSRSKKLCEIHS